MFQENLAEIARRLENDEGTLDQQEKWLNQLKESDPNFLNSDRMHGLDMAIQAKQLAQQKSKTQGKLSRIELIKLVEKIIAAEGTESEVNANVLLLKSNVPHPLVSDLIYWPEKEMSPEEIVDEALAYKASGT